MVKRQTTYLYQFAGPVRSTFGNRTEHYHGLDSGKLALEIYGMIFRANVYLDTHFMYMFLYVNLVIRQDRYTKVDQIKYLELNDRQKLGRLTSGE